MNAVLAPVEGMGTYALTIGAPDASATFIISLEVLRAIQHQATQLLAGAL